MTETPGAGSDTSFLECLPSTVVPKKTTSPFRNGSHLPTTQCACANFVDFAAQHNGRRGREKDLYRVLIQRITRDLYQNQCRVPEGLSGPSHMLYGNLPMRGSALFAPYTSVSEPCIVVTKQIGNPWRCLECGFMVL
jgi:hypothetical protein